jgi:hypothetical protein
MRTALSLVLTVAAVISLIARSDDGAGNGGNGSASGDVDCAAFCARTLDCDNDPAPDCLRSCQLSSNLCPAESGAALGCSIPRPDSDYYCEPQAGVTAPREGVCMAEYDALFECVLDAAL